MVGHKKHLIDLIRSPRLLPISFSIWLMLLAISNVTEVRIFMDDIFYRTNCIGGKDTDKFLCVQFPSSALRSLSLSLPMIQLVQ